MRFRLQRASPLRRPPLWAVLIVLLWASLVAVGVYLTHFRGAHVELCPMKRYTGLPCPTCGTTRGIIALLSGHPLDGFLYNPLVFTVLPAVAVVLLLRVFFHLRVGLEMTRRERITLWIILPALVVANWIYLILRGV